MNVALIYTSTTPELIETVEREVKKVLGKNVDLMTYEDGSILKDTIEAGKVTGKAAGKLVTLYMRAVGEGADAILNLCSSVGEVADACQDIANFIGVPIVRVDEAMCCEAVRNGKKIGVMATLLSTLEPTKNTLLRVARELGKDVELVDGLIEGAFGLDQDLFKERMLHQAEEMKNQVDVLLFAQGSMAYCEEYIAEKVNKRVLSSPGFGARELQRVLEKKGLM